MLCKKLIKLGDYICTHVGLHRQEPIIMLRKTEVGYKERELEDGGRSCLL